ncbi:MAG: hypothetical protein ACI8R9_000116 [Paraglaciecola sp.]|jgi:hypothetical protein
MTISYIPLDKEKHKDLKIKLQHDFAHAKDAHIAAASIREYAQLASVMPIVFVKDPKSDSFHTVVMLGTEKGTNLFVQDGKWQVHCLPLNIQRYPFDVRPDGDKLGVFIDENSDLISDEGEPVFTEEGTPSQFLENRQQLLSELANSEMATQRFIKQLVEFDLLEPIELMVNYVDGQKRNVTGMHGISEKRLQDLSDDKILTLHKSGFLGAAYAVLMSLGQLNRLVQLSNNSTAPIQNLQLRVGEAVSGEQPAAGEQPAVGEQPAKA